MASRAALAGLKTTVISTPHQASPAGVTCMVIQQHANGDRIITGGMDKNVVISNKNGDVQAKLSGHGKKVTAVAFGPTALFSGSADGVVKVWSGADNRNERSFDSVHKGEVSAVSAHPAGGCLVSFSLDGSWALLDVASGATVRQIGVTGPSKEFEYNSGQVHPDGMLVGGGTSSGVLKIWDIREQKNVGNLEGHGGSVESLCFSENGYFLASGDTKGTLRLWDLRKMKCNQTLEG